MSDTRTVRIGATCGIAGVKWETECEVPADMPDDEVITFLWDWIVSDVISADAWLIKKGESDD